MAKQTGSPAGGSISMLVLALLHSGEMYGYQIIEELEKRSNNVFQLKEGTLYPVLHGLERDKLIAGREQASPSGRKRRYYQITSQGLKALEEKKAQWDTYSSAVSAILAEA